MDKAHLVLTGPTPADLMIPSSSTSMPFDPVMPGTYQAEITLLDVSGAPVTKAVKSTMVDVQIGNQTTITVAFLADDYLNSYTGNFDFLLSWGAAGKACAAVTPAVTMETLTLVKMGSATPVAAMTNTMHKLDGTPAGCFTMTGAMQYEEVAALPWGYYDLTVTGKAAGAVAYCKKFKVFTGPGVANPTFSLVVDNVNGFDGGASACP